MKATEIAQNKDPVLTEIRQIREQIANEHGDDLHLIVQALQAKALIEAHPKSKRKPLTPKFIPAAA